VKTPTAVAGGDTPVDLAEEGIRGRRRPLTHQVSLSLFVIAGVGLLATAVCIVLYGTGWRDAVPWHILAIFFGLPSALCATFACWVHALDDMRSTG
jgi:hypothetical protein